MLTVLVVPLAARCSTLKANDLDAGPPRAELVRQVLLRQGDAGVNTYRIPGLTTTKAGSLVAVFDMRYDSLKDLPARIDIGIRRSTDLGKTWGPTQVILHFKNEPGAEGNGVGDPCIVADLQTGTIWVAGLWSHGKHGTAGSGPGLSPDETGQFVLTRSDDDGRTWSKPINITAQVKRPEWRYCFQGPGRGIQLRDGTLVIPGQFKDGDGVPHSFFIYSDDHGSTWRPSPPATPDRNPWSSESQVAELPNGDLLLTMRNSDKSGRRVWAIYSRGKSGSLADGSWSPVWYALPDPGCQGALLAVPATHGEGVLLYSAPAAKPRDRMTLYLSRDGGRTWPVSKLLDPRPSSYSCMTVLPDGSIGMLYETGFAYAAATLTYVRFNLDWLTAAPAMPADGALADLAALKAKLKNRKHPLTWVFTGDSVTQGAKWVGEYRPYPEIVEERVRWELGRVRDLFVNSAVSGAVSKDLLADFDWRVLRFHPDVVSIMIGMNDCGSGWAGRERFAQNLHELIQRVRAAGAIPILNGTNPIDILNPQSKTRKDLPAYNDLIRKVAAWDHVIEVDNWKHWMIEKPTPEALRAWLANPIHPNAAGHRQFAISLFKTLGIYDPKAPMCQP